MVIPFSELVMNYFLSDDSMLLDGVLNFKGFFKGYKLTLDNKECGFLKNIVYKRIY